MKKLKPGLAMLGAAAACLGLSHWTRRPMKIDRKNLSWLLDKPIAHRGIHDNETSNPENTLAAFELAAEAGYPIELDVRLTKDKKVVVIHDKELDRLLGLHMDIQDVTYAFIEKMKILNSDQKVPLFQEVLSLVDGRVPLLVELKTHKRPGPLEKRVYGMLRKYPGKYAVQSFNPLSVKWFKDHAPEAVRGQLSGNFNAEPSLMNHGGGGELSSLQKVLLKNLMVNFIAKPNFIAYELKGTPHIRLIKIRRLGVPLLCWTVKNRVEYLEVKDLCDNVITDDPAVVF